MRTRRLFRASDNTRSASRLATAKQVMSHLPGCYGITAILITLGALTALAESVGITLIVLFVYASLNQLETLASAYALMKTDVLGLGSLSDLGQRGIAAAIVAMILLKSALGIFNALLSNKVYHDIELKVSNRLFAELLAKPYLELTSYDRGELVSIIMVERHALANAHASLVRIGINLGSAAVFGLFLLATSWQIALIVGIGAFLHGRLMRLFATSMNRLGAEAVESTNALNLLVYMTLQGLRTVFTFACEISQERKLAALLRRSGQIRRTADAIGYLGQPISEIFTLGLLAVVLFSSAILGVPLASVMASLVLIYRLQPNLRSLDSEHLALDNIRASLQVLDGFLTDKTTPPAVGTLPFSYLSQRITYRDVTMVYPGAARPSLVNATFSIPAGRRTAILGPSGSGKSTIISMLLKLFRPTSGAILVDGVPLDDIRRIDWISRVAFAGQDAELVEGTIRENITFVRANVTDEMIHRAVTMAGLADFVAQLPYGYDEWLGDAGYAISGGQRQRIGLARALVCDPEILILDEATSAIDDALCSAIRATIWRELSNRTVIVITHDLSIVEEFDYVVCLKPNGEIAEEGTPRALLADSGSALRVMLNSRWGAVEVDNDGPPRQASGGR